MSGELPGTPYATSDNPNILIFPPDFNVGLNGYNFSGVETVTYVYQPAGYVPEPPAYMMLGTACLVLLAARYTLSTGVGGGVLGPPM